MPRTDFLKTGIIITAVPLQTLKVVIKDKRGNPLKDAQVSLGYPVQGIGRVENTDAGGMAVFDQILVGGRHDLRVELKGYRFPQESLQLPEVGSANWKDDIELTMEDSGSTQ